MTPLSQSKNIIFSFDGTGQRPEDAIQLDDGKTSHSNISNVSKLHLLCGGDFQNNTFSNSFYRDEMEGKQINFYYAGIGTYGNTVRQTFNTAFALGDVDVILKKAMSDLRQVYRQGDKVFAIGFSRGAALARRFCATVSQEPTTSDAKVEMLICFDTVASIGLPDISTDNRPKGEDVFENGKVARNVVQALHCCSIDENRRAYQPTLMNKEDRVTEIWFAGDHVDVGGGRADKDGLSSLVLQFVLDEIARREVGLRILSTEQVKLEEISAATQGVEIEDDDLEIEPNAHGVNHKKPDGWLNDNRRIVVIENDQIDENELPVLHHSVAERIMSQSLDSPYQPKNLKKVPHKVLLPDCTHIQMSGLDDYFPLESRSRLSFATA